MAIIGSDLYRELGQSLSQARGDLDRVGRELNLLTGEVERLHGEEARALAELARVRLAELAGQRIAQGLDGADRQAMALLEQRRAAAARVQQELAAVAARRQELEAERERARAAGDAAAAAHEGVRAATLERLGATETWELQQERAERALQRARAAADKARQAEADREQKGKPYAADKLFAYLWARRYRFPEYRANALTRELDGWVARLAGYERAHRDYALLLEIPLRLAAHAARLEAQASAEAKALQSLADEALAQDGVPALAETARLAEQAVVAVEQRIGAAEQHAAALAAERASLDAGEDPGAKAALSTLTAQVEREDVATLWADAQATPTPADDALVARIRELRGQRATAQERAEALRPAQQRALDALRELEDVQRRFRQRGFDAGDSEFLGGIDAGAILAGLLAGALRGTDAFGRLERHQRFRRSRGAGGIGSVLDGLGSVLGSASRGSPGGFGGGGGFRTGGGFGGGGFRTGGGF